jgi:hypothetical protein
MRTSRAGHQAVCGVNGDFYDTSNGVPLSPCLINGEFTHTPFIYRNGFGFTEDRKGTIFNPVISSVIISQDGQASYSLSNVNLNRQEDQICMFNHFFGSSTGTGGDGTECLITAITDWVVNDTVYCVVDACDSVSNNRSIPETKSVLSGIGAGADFLQAYCQAGDTIKIVQTFPKDVNQVTQFMGGACKMMENGENVAEEYGTQEYVWGPYLYDRNPRTVIGFNGDSTLIYFVVVDGRQAGFSIGMGMDELVEFMSAIGVKNAVNLDGGGSSTMVVRHSVKNSGSDGNERAVANSVLCYSSAPTGSFAHVQLPKDSLNVYKNKSINTNLSGWDEYYNPYAIPWDQIDIDYDESLGSFNENVFSAYETNGDCFLTATVGTETDRVVIHIIELTDLDVFPEAVTIDSVNGVNFEVRAIDENGTTLLYDNDIFEFTVLDPSIATVNVDGAIIGKTSGETKVIVRYGDQRDTALVSVEIGEGEVVVDEIESIDNWSISGDSYINMSGTSISLTDRSAGAGSKAVRVDYDHSGSVDGMISIATDPVNIYGVPSYILVDVLADSQKNWIYIDLQDARGVDYSVKCSSSLRYKDDYRTQYLDMANLLPADGEQLYPLKITGIRLRIDDKATTGSMYIDRIRLIYPGWTAIDDEPVMIPSGYCLHQNYPNPFNPSTTINYEIPEASRITLDVFDMNGRLVKTLYKGYRSAGVYQEVFSADQLTSGVYFYKLTAGSWTDTKKMLIIK